MTRRGRRAVPNWRPFCARSGPGCGRPTSDSRRIPIPTCAGLPAYGAKRSLCRHLRNLAGLATAVDEPRVGDVLPRLQRLVDAACPSIASVYDVHLDYVVWNMSYAWLRHDPATLPDDRRNLLWMMFTDADSRGRLVRWEPAARAVLGQFRAAAGRRPDDPRFATLVAELSEASLEFRKWWAEYPVRDFRPATIGIDHPQIGRLHLEMFQLRPVEHPDLLMVPQVPASEHDLQRVTALLGHP